MVLQTSPQVCKLNRGNRSCDSTVLFRMKFVLTWIHEDAVAVYISLIVDWFVWLSAVVEGYRIRPHVLLSFANLLAVVLPVHAMPKKVVVDAVFEAGPDRGARIRCRRIDHDRARCWTTAVVDPVPVTALTFFSSALDVVAERTRVPDIDRAVELLHVMLGDKGRKSSTGPGIGVNVIGELTYVLVLRWTRFVWQIQKRDRVGKFLLKKSDPVVGFAPGAHAIVK